MTTARKLIQRALVTSGVSGRNEQVSSEDINDGLLALNDMIASWSNESLLVYARTWEEFNISGGVSEYTIGTGGDFNTARPIFIANAYTQLTSDTFREHLSIVSGVDFNQAITTDSTQGQPEYLNYDNAFPLGKIRLWPVPSSARTLSILSEKELSQFTLDDEVSFPPGWERTLRFNLAVELSAEYGIEPLPEVQRIARESKANIERATNRVRSMDSHPSGNDTFNINTGFNR